MNILFVLYGDFSSNSANPLALYARELKARGHSCVIAVPRGLETVNLHENYSFRPALYDSVLTGPKRIFPDGRPADVVHACTPREIVRRFVTAYMAKSPAPLVIFLEDNERWLAARKLGLEEASLARHTEKHIDQRLPNALSHPFRYPFFIGLADSVAVIQDKLKQEVPPWVYCETVMIGADLESFTPRQPDSALRIKYGVGNGEKVIVYHGGMNEYTRPGLRSLCDAVALINSKAFPCRLLRSGPMRLDFLDEMPREVTEKITDVGVLPRRELPELLALADVFVQPGKNDAFENLRLPGKIPEFLAVGRPVIIPDTNISYLFRDGVDAVLLGTGTAEEIAEKCIDMFRNPERASSIGKAGRAIAEKYFDARLQAQRLEHVYAMACERFDVDIASRVWKQDRSDTSIMGLLRRRLECLAASDTTRYGISAADMLREHGDFVEVIDKRMEGLQAAIQDRDHSIGLMQQAIFERDARIATLDRMLAEREGQLNALVSSTSWRITRPLRYTKRQIMRLFGSGNT